jgi:alkylation response protein AidB-like acyl-CoA dehydrogenase
MTTLLYTDVEDELRATVRQVLTDRAPWSAVLKRTESDEPYDTGLWRILSADIGVTELPVPASGATWREAAVVAEEMGRAVAPVPYLGVSMATAALLAAGEGPGAETAVLVAPLSARQAPAGATVTSVADALAADVLIVPAADGFYAVPAAEATIEPVLSLDLTRRLADVTVDVSRGRRLDVDPAVAWDRAWTAGVVLLASEQLGVAEWCLSTTVEYVKTRYQFGRPVGSFQALKHRLAELWVAVTQARAVARYAAGCLADDDPDLAVAASLAQAHCAPVAVKAAEECVQMHGGIGFTWEHPAHLYLKRAKSAAIALGTPDWHRARLAELVDL